MNETKLCPSCGVVKSEDEFYKTKAGKCRTYCIPCYKIRVKEWEVAHPERVKEIGRNKSYRKRGVLGPMSQNKDCALYLGVVVAERVLANMFSHVERMPNCNRGFDFICGKGFRIDCKSSAMRCHRGDYYWMFAIDRNIIADYFLCLAFDDRDSLNPLHAWMIPGEVVSHLKRLAIPATEYGLNKWSQWERQITRVVECCDQLKSKV